MDDPKEYLKDKTRKEKFSLESLHEKWKRKGKVNFKNIDFKFDTKRTRPVMTEYKTEEDQRQQKKFFDILHGLHYNSSKKDEIEINKSAKNDMKNNMNNKYENKSYYLSTKMPWNNNSVFDDKDRNDLNKKIKENIKNVRIKNEIIMNKNKSYKTLKERFVKNSFLIKEAKKNKFIEEETKKLYKKITFENPGIEKYPEKINALIFKEMINLYQEYSNYIQDKKNINKKSKEKFERNNDKNKLKSKHFFTDKEIFEKLEILLTYLKINKIKVDHKQFLRPLLLDYNKVIEREDYLKKTDEEYLKYINQNKKEEEKVKTKNILNISKYPINEITEKEKIENIYSYHNINLEETHEKNKLNRKINYFLTAYKNVFDDNYNNKTDKNKIPILITERSTNPYGTFDLLKNDNKNEEIKNSENKINKLKQKKRPNSSYGTRKLNITYYHPGSFYLFKEDSKEYYAWSCCLNEDKYSKGCSKKFEKVLNFIYKDNI